MSENTATDLKDLKQVTEGEAAPAADAKQQAAATEAPKREPKRDDLGRSYGTGRRKDAAVARVWIMPGKGKIIINGKDQTEYLRRGTHQLIINQPFLVANRVNEFDVMCTVKGGGLSGQAGAIRHGISRALVNYEPETRDSLKKAGLLTRDSRAVERKKIGKHKARRSKQWAKR